LTALLIELSKAQPAPSNVAAILKQRGFLDATGVLLVPKA